MRVSTAICVFLTFFGGAFSVDAQPVQIRVISWNLESGESDNARLASQMAGKGQIDLWGFSELNDQQALDAFDAAVEAATRRTYTNLISTNNGNDKLGILFDSGRFTMVSPPQELSQIQAGNPGLRPALAVRLKGNTTGQEFVFVVNHFKASGGRQNINTRKKQVQAMNAFAAAQSVPVVMVGDLNIPFDIATGTSEPNLKLLTQNGEFEWIEPAVKAKTQASNFNSILDYVMVANKVSGWTGESMILEREGNTPAAAGSTFSDSPADTDHRPVLAVLEIDLDDDREAIEEEISGLEARLKELRERLLLLQGAANAPAAAPTTASNSN